jgi:hypothetical protein
MAPAKPHLCGLVSSSFFAANTKFSRCPQAFIKEHHQASSSWQKVLLKGLEDEIKAFRNEEGFEQIASDLGILFPRKVREQKL